MDVNERRGGGYAPPEEVSSALADLERTGGAVLLVGDGPEWIGRHVRKRLYGDDSEQARYRIHVSTAASSSFPRPARPPLAGERTTIRYVTARRGATKSVARGAHAGPDRVCTSLSELGIAISEAIEEFEERTGGLEPGQLRLGFDSVIPLLEEDKAAAFRFLHLLVKRVGTVRGVIHVPLSRPYDSEIVRLFAPLFDVVVEVRLTGGTTQQRWHFLERNRTSGWLTPSR